MDEELKMLAMLQHGHPLDRLQSVVPAEELLACQQAVREVEVHDKVRQYLMQIIHDTRENEDLALGASPRASIALFRACQAMAAIRGGDFDKAVALFGSFQRRFPASGYTDSVRFWHGNALYGQRQHKEAIAAFRAFVTGAPDHPRAPEALLALANSQAEMKDVRGARRTLEELVKSYPQSEAAAAGKQRLASLK